MPDQVHCTRDSSHTFTCEVLIGPDPEPRSEPPPAARPQPAPPAREPAVMALVQRFEQISLPAPELPYLSSKALIACAGDELSILLAGIAKGPLAPIVALKAGYEVGKCLADQRTDASAAAARKEVADDCAARGGAVTSVVEDRSVCEVGRPTGRP